MPITTKVAGKPFQRGDVYYARINGVRTSLGTSDAAAAQAYCDKLNAEGFISNGLGVAPKRSWQEAVVRRSEELRGLASEQLQLEYLKFWHPFLGGVDDLNKITREMIDQVIVRERSTKGLMPGVKASGNTTANKYVKAVQTTLNNAEKEWQWAGVRAPKLRLYPEPDGRKVALTPMQVWQAIAELPDHSRDIALYACATMHRRGNITGLRWEWIDFQRETLFIPGQHMKNRTDFVVPLNATAMAIIKCRAIHTDRHPEFVFHYRGGKIKQVVTKTWRDTMHGALGEQQKVVLHTMRHSASSWLVQRGINLATVAWLGGWSLPNELGAMKRYLHANVERLRPFSEMLDQELVDGRRLFDAARQAVPVLSHQPAERALLAA